jgi:hypothetical protein
MASLADVITAAQAEQARLAQREDRLRQREAAMQSELELREAALDQRMIALTNTNNQLQTRITLNVGGVSFITSMTSLEAEPDNLILTSAKHGKVMQGDNVQGSIFFDRDSTVFPFIINWLRSKACNTPFLAPETKHERQLLMIEAGYYLLNDLVVFLKEDDKIASQEIVEYDVLIGTMKLEYSRAERVCSVLSKKVNQAINLGWQPFGSLFTSTDKQYGSTITGHQPMVRYGTSIKRPNEKVGIYYYRGGDNKNGVKL